MTRFAKIPEVALDVVPDRLVKHYARLSLARDFSTGRIEARSWAEVAVLMRCSERSARRAAATLTECGALDGEPPALILPHCVGTSDDTSDDTNDDTSDNTPILQRDQNISFAGYERVAARFWEQFTQGHKGKSFKCSPVRARALAPLIADSLRGGLAEAELMRGALEVGRRYAEGGFGWPSSADGYRRLVAAAEGVPPPAEQTGRKFNAEAWKAGGTGWEA